MIVKLSKYTDKLLFMGVALPLFLYDFISIWIIMARGSLFSNLELCCVRLVIVVLCLFFTSAWLTIRFKSKNLYKSLLFCIACFVVFYLYSFFYILLSVLLDVLVIPVSIIFLYIICILFCIIFEKVFRCKISKKFLFALELMGVILLSLVSFYIGNKVFSFYSVYLRLVVKALISIGVFKLVNELFSSIGNDSHVNEVSLKSQVIRSLIAIVLFIVVFIVINFNFITEDSEKIAFESLYNDCSDCVNNGDLDLALRYSKLLVARKNMINSLTGVEHYNIALLYEDYPDDYVIGGLYLTSKDCLNTLEDKVFKQELSGKEWNSILLKWYSDLDDLSDYQKDLRKNLLVEMLLDRQYTYSNILMSDDVKALSSYDEEYINPSILDNVNMVLCAVVEYEKTGLISRNTAINALDLAEKYVDDFSIQYYSIIISLNYRYDNAEHYSRIAESVKRLDECYDRNDYSKYNNLGLFMELCNHYKEAVEYYEIAYSYEKTPDIILSCARAYEKLGDYESCCRFSDELIFMEPDNVEALYLKALSCLKSRNIDEMIDVAGKIDGDSADNDKYLFSLAHYISISNNPKYTDYDYKIYNSLTDEQEEALMEDTVLWNYSSALYHTFTDRNYELALECVNHILDNNSDLLEAKYLKGVIYQNKNDYESALKYYKEAEDCGLSTKALYYSIANVYDALGMYEESYRYSLYIDVKYSEIDDSLNMNHQDDIYGISYHNKNLLDALREELDLEVLQ